MYNTLNTNNITSTISLNTNTTSPSYDITANDAYTRYTFLLNTLTRSHNLTSGNLNPTYLTDNHQTAKFNSFANTTKDLTLVMNDFDVLNVDNLELLHNFSNVINNYSADLTFFNINSYNLPLTQTSLTFNSKTSNTKTNVILNTTFLNSDNKLLSDMYL